MEPGLDMGASPSREWRTVSVSSASTAGAEILFVASCFAPSAGASAGTGGMDLATSSSCVRTTAFICRERRRAAAHCMCYLPHELRNILLKQHIGTLDFLRQRVIAFAGTLCTPVDVEVGT